MLIGALVAGLILFLWQFLSYGLLGIHTSQMQYTDKQDEILDALAASGLEEGQYFLPNVPADASAEDREALMTDAAGQPWAQVFYHDELSTNVGMNMFRAFVVDILAALLLIWVMLKFANLDMKTSVMASIAVGLTSSMPLWAGLWSVPG